MQSAYLRQPVRLGTLAIRFDKVRCNQSSPEPFELQSDVRADCDVVRAEDEHRDAREHVGGEVRGGGAHPEQHAIDMQ